MLYFVQIILQILTICLNICLISHLSYCLAWCCNSPADCSYRGHPDSGSDPSRAVVKISSAYSWSSNFIPFSPSGLRDPRVQVSTPSTNYNLLHLQQGYHKRYAFVLYLFINSHITIFTIYFFFGVFESLQTDLTRKFEETISNTTIRINSLEIEKQYLTAKAERIVTK